MVQTEPVVKLSSKSLEVYFSKKKARKIDKIPIKIFDFVIINIIHNLRLISISFIVYFILIRSLVFGKII